MEDENECIKSQILTSNGDICSVDGSLSLYLPDDNRLCLLNTSLLPLCDPIPIVHLHRSSFIMVSDKLLLSKCGGSQVRVFQLNNGMTVDFESMMMVSLDLCENAMPGYIDEMVMCENQLFVLVNEFKESKWIGIMDRMERVFKKINLRLLRLAWIDQFAVEDIQDGWFMLYIYMEGSNIIHCMKMRMGNEDALATMEGTIPVETHERISLLMCENQLLHVFYHSGRVRSYNKNGGLRQEW